MWRGVQRRVARGIGVLRGRRRRHLTLDDLAPAANIRVLDDGSHCGLDDDPCFRGPLRLPAGWYRWRVQLRVPHRRHDHCHGNARLFVDVGAGESETLAMNLPFRAGEPAERIVRLLRPGWIRFDPIEYAGRFRVEAFAIERLDSPPDAVVADWDAYNQRLERPVAETLSYGRWLVDAEAPLLQALLDRARPLLDAAGAAERLCTVLSAGGPDRAAWQAAIAAAPGRWLVLPGSDDCLADAALPALADAERAAPDAVLIYADHDWLDDDGFRCEPQFKPGWSPEFQADADYIGPIAWLRRDWVLAQLEQLPDPDVGTADALRRWLLARVAAANPPASVVRLPMVLCHRRQAAAATIAAKPPAAPRWQVPTPSPLVSLLIPTRDGGAHLQRCVASILRTRGAVRVEIVLIDNQSSDPATCAYLDACADPATAPGAGADGVTLRVLRHNAPFNFSVINNRAAALAQGTVLGLINDDVEAIEPGWLDALVARALDPAIGCVGPLLDYPDGRIQHAGVTLGVGGVASHPHRGLPADAPGYADWLRAERNVSVVTGAALFIRADLYRSLGGMNPQLTVAYNDVDLCLKAVERGYRNLCTPAARLLHHESLSRGDDFSAEKAARLASESAILRERWGAQLDADPYYNPNLSHTCEDLTLDKAPCWRPLVTVARSGGLE